MNWPLRRGNCILPQWLHWKFRIVELTPIFLDENQFCSLFVCCIITIFMELPSMGLLCLGTGWIIFSVGNSRTVIFQFFKLLIFKKKKKKMSPPESQSAQRWLTHGRHFQRNIPALLTECAAPSAEACCRRDAARSLFLSTRAVGRPPSTSFLPERAVPCFHFLSAAARARSRRSAWDFEQEAAQDIKFRGFKSIVLCDPHQSPPPSTFF